ncbi:FtsW/RodA/SpoVE family cell cycle protein [Sporolactobacillus pectinivorans]|uniref:FtsW/RodA/SpoVE family cell cycle protein n=1 Tax=Sporolactobacillus pectinivorans TaxID=1591408 RepID=UPI000C26BC11|nr:FtsW/RodA/SpoVE family cell cycle protein [Sporolactobacillus pectinivorans]
MIKKLFLHYDYSFLVVMMLLISFGMIMIYSAGSVWATLIYKNASPDYFFVRQMIWFVGAAFFGLIGLLVPYQAYRSAVKPLLICSLGLLILLYFAGSTSNNAQSWLNIGFFNLQPSEFVKITIIFYLASVFSNKQKTISKFSTSVAPPLIVVSVFFVIIAKEPDLGTAMIIIAISFAMILCAGLKMKHLIWLMGGSGILVYLYFTKLLSANEAGRFTAAYDPFAVANSTGRQLINSYIAIASGGLLGKGLGRSIEKTGFLPEPQTDFIIAIIGEELGLIGVLFVVLCIAYLVFRGFVTAIRCKDVFGSLLAIGISSMVAVQTLVNLGVATGLLPLTGVPLPFISYGGSSLVVMVFSICVLMNISAFVNMKRTSSTTEGKRENVEAYD